MVSDFFGSFWGVTVAVGTLEACPASVPALPLLLPRCSDLCTFKESLAFSLISSTSAFPLRSPLHFSSLKLLFSWSLVKTQEEAWQVAHSTVAQKSWVCVLMWPVTVKLLPHDHSLDFQAANHPQARVWPKRAPRGPAQPLSCVCRNLSFITCAQSSPQT